MCCMLMIVIVMIFFDFSYLFLIIKLFVMVGKYILFCGNNCSFLYYNLVIVFLIDGWKVVLRIYLCIGDLFFVLKVVIDFVILVGWD